jgi:hypothetical protein
MTEGIQSGNRGSIHLSAPLVRYSVFVLSVPIRVIRGRYLPSLARPANCSGNPRSARRSVRAGPAGLHTITVGASFSGLTAGATGCRGSAATEKDRPPVPHQLGERVLMLGGIGTA